MTDRCVDAERLAGPSCPAVAGAHLVVRCNLDLPGPETVPQRGTIAVFLCNDRMHAGVLDGLCAAALRQLSAEARVRLTVSGVMINTCQRLAAAPMAFIPRFLARSDRP